MKLKNDESQAIVQSVTREEIKDAFFDIAEYKALGPDGYSSGFYKAAWPVIGEEMIKAILEFFTTGRLLKQVNTTILALIPKHLRLVLDKLISPSQNAFVPGRSIGDNILLAQELFAGYNRQGLPMRFAFKVDLRKAYDTVEWDILSVVLQLFGFSGTFIGWVEECVTTPMFSNEGFSFHWRCKELGLFQLCFADDLLLFCKADVDSVRVFKHGLDEFAKLSGLHANPQKSQLILSRSAQDVQEQLLAALHFQEGHLPLRYLGLPLLASRLSISDFYWAMAFILPKGVIREVEKKMRTFLWKGNSAVGYPKVAWSVVCKPIEEGGQGIRDILALNKALMSLHLWNVIQNNQSSIWEGFVLCGREMETHEHLFFWCNYSLQCIRILKGTVRFTWPNRAWAVDIAWASKRWNGRHIVQEAYRALLAAIVYHIWQERNRRVFQQSMRPSSTIARIVVDKMR
ncbi:hypothetical protein Sango_2776800 [Sesamum angolense]|uniref:Reverse transcriptase domain-containing protein n=1 Tax=Sesamum angolense TaxID=2727404 RepID=A0AAE1T978_9LAMI|nr:hypothetical protein Sango_2776800 [Sesamum angolense]